MQRYVLQYYILSLIKSVALHNYNSMLPAVYNWNHNDDCNDDGNHGKDTANNDPDHLNR